MQSDEVCGNAVGSQGEEGALRVPLSIAELTVEELAALDALYRKPAFLV